MISIPNFPGSFERLRDDIRDALIVSGLKRWGFSIEAIFPDRVVYSVSPEECCSPSPSSSMASTVPPKTTFWQAAYSQADGVLTLQPPTEVSFAVVQESLADEGTGIPTLSSFVGESLDAEAFLLAFTKGVPLTSGVRKEKIHPFISKLRK